jgi:hypothetical protein
VSCYETIAVKRRRDVLRVGIDLPLRGTYHPLGFLLHIVTNSRDVLEAAEEAWGNQPQEFACEAMEFRVVVEPRGDLCSFAMHRAQGNLYSAVSDPYNFAMLDTSALTGSIFVSQRTAADHNALRWFFIEASAYMLLAQRYAVPVHSACVAHQGAGMMLCGQSGAGKSTLAYACARAGWTYVSDDAVFLLPDSPSPVAIGRSQQARLRPDAPSLFPELGGFAMRAGFTGKISIEVPMSAFPEIRTAARVGIESIMLLDRRPGPARLEPVTPDEAFDELLNDAPNYGDEVDAMHDRTLRQLGEVPAFRMHYESFSDAIELLQTHLS